MLNNYNIISTFVRKRGENYNVYIEYIDENGKSKQKSIGKYKTKKEADKHLIDLKSSINNNRFIISKDITLVERCYKYVEDNKDEWSPYTTLNRNSWIKNQIQDFFKDTLLRDLTIYQCQQFYNYLLRNYSSESVKTRYGFFNAVLNECYRLKEIQENPCDFIKTSKKENKNNINVYTREEVIDLIEKLNGHFIEIPILLMLLLGLRKGEAVGLQWQDIDFENNIININKTLVYVNREILLKEPKTEDSKRSIHAPIELMEQLKKEKLRQNKLKLEGVLENEYNLVCLSPHMRPYVHTRLNHRFTKFCKKYKVREIRIHDLRHTNASLLLLGNTNMKVVSERLGHSDIKITMNKYSHVLEEMDKKASENLSKLLYKKYTL